MYHLSYAHTIQPVAQPVVPLIVQLVVSCKRGVSLIGMACWRPMLLSFFDGRLGDHLRMYWMDLHQIFRICTIHMLGCDLHFSLIAIAQGRCYDNWCLARIGENWHIYTPHLHSVRAGGGSQHGYARVNSTSDKNFVNFGSVTLRFAARLHRVGYTLGFATHFSLSLLGCIAAIAAYCYRRNAVN